MDAENLKPAPHTPIEESENEFLQFDDLHKGILEKHRAEIIELRNTAYINAGELEIDEERRAAVFEAQQDNKETNEIKGMPSRFLKSLSRCGDAECWQCAVMACPGGHPLHLHHDGCPFCHGLDTKLTGDDNDSDA